MKATDLSRYKKWSLSLITTYCIVFHSYKWRYVQIQNCFCCCKISTFFKEPEEPPNVEIKEEEEEEEEAKTPTAAFPEEISAEMSPERTVAKLQRRMSEHKSFEMEDIPNTGIPILCHQTSQKRRLPQLPSTRESSKSRFDYPIVRHHPLFAKQRRDGSRSNFSSLLLGENVRIIRRRGPFDDRRGNGNGGQQGSKKRL